MFMNQINAKTRVALGVTNTMNILLPRNDSCQRTLVVTIHFYAHDKNREGVIAIGQYSVDLII